MTEEIELELDPAPYRFGHVDLNRPERPVRSVVREVRGLPRIVAVAAGWVHSVALAADGSL